MINPLLIMHLIIKGSRLLIIQFLFCSSGRLQEVKKNKENFKLLATCMKGGHLLEVPNIII